MIDQIDPAELRRMIREARDERKGAIRAARARQRQWRRENEELAAASWLLRNSPAPAAEAGYHAAKIAERISDLIEPNGTTPRPAEPGNHNDERS